MTDTPLFTLRDVAKDDIPFIFNSWLKSYRDSPTVAGVPNTIFYAEHHRVIEGILETPGVKVVVACNPEDPSQIYGYVVARMVPGIVILDWVYTKHPFRSHGIARRLLDLVTTTVANTPVHYTHRVKSGDRLLKNRAFTFNPYHLLEALK